MPNAPVATMDDLASYWRQQNPDKPMPMEATSPDNAVRGLEQVPGDPGAFAGSSKAMDLLNRFNEFQRQQDAAGGAAGPGVGPTDSVGGQPAMQPGGVGGPVPAQPVSQGVGPRLPTITNGAGQGGGNPPPATVNGQGVIPPNGVIGPQQFPGAAPPIGAAPPGGHNMRITNGTQQQDVQYTPQSGGGVLATTMRDGGSGVTFVMGPNGQYYPAGSPQQGAGQSFLNAQTNLTQLGIEQDQASRLGLTPDPATLAALREARLAGASPNSPIGQQIIRQSIAQYNQNQTELERARIATTPANRQIDLMKEQFSKEDRKAYNDTYSNTLKRLASENSVRRANGRPAMSEDEMQTIAQREANQELFARQGQMGGPAGVRGASQPAPSGVPAPAPGGGSSSPVGGGPLSQLPPGNPGVLNTPAAQAGAAGKDRNAIKGDLYGLINRITDEGKKPLDAATFVQGLQNMPGLLERGALSENHGAALKEILAANPQLAQNLRANLASNFLNLAGQSGGARPWNNLEMAGMVGGAPRSDSVFGIGGGGPGVNSAVQGFAGGSLLPSVGSVAASRLAGMGAAAGGAAAPTLTPGASAPAAGMASRAAAGVRGAATGLPGRTAALEGGVGLIDRNVGEGVLSAMNPFNTHLGVYDTLSGEFIPSNNETRNTTLGNLGGTMPQATINQQMLTTALLMRYLRAGQ